MSKKSKVNKEAEIQAMKDFIQETFAGLGATIELDPDQDLENYSRGSLMSLDDIKKLRKDDVVWIDHKEGNRTRFKGAQRFMGYDMKSEEWTFGDGSCFVTPVYKKEWEEQDKTFYAGDDHQLKFYTAKKK